MRANMIACVNCAPRNAALLCATSEHRAFEQWRTVHTHHDEDSQDAYVYWDRNRHRTFPRTSSPLGSSLFVWLGSTSELQYAPENIRLSRQLI